jgi:hypothetical protein
MRIKLISVLLFFVLSIQLLPLTQIGEALYQNQLTEEINHTDAPNPASLTEEIHKQFDHSAQIWHLALYERRVSESIHLAEKIYSRFHEDVEIQPPDILVTAC